MSAATRDDYVPLACDDYDVLELVCLDRYEVELELRGGERVVGTATTLENDGRAEYLIIASDDGTLERVRIDRLHKLIVCTRPSRLDAFVF